MPSWRGAQLKTQEQLYCEACDISKFISEQFISRKTLAQNGYSP
jgi:hypothetical protein